MPNVVELNSTTFKTTFYNKILKALKEEMNIDFGMNLYTRASIRSMLAATKKKN